MTLHTKIPVKDLNSQLFLLRISKFPDLLPNSADVGGRKLNPERKSSGLKNIQVRAAGAFNVKKHFVDNILNIS